MEGTRSEQPFVARLSDAVCPALGRKGGFIARNLFYVRRICDYDSPVRNDPNKGGGRPGGATGTGDLCSKLENRSTFFRTLAPAVGFDLAVRPR